jgi:hypothetical protein
MNINHDFRQITHHFLHNKPRVYKIQKQGIYFFSETYRSALGLILLPKCVVWAPSLGGGVWRRELPGREAGRSPPFTTNIANLNHITSTSSEAFLVSDSDHWRTGTSLNFQACTTRTLRWSYGSWQHELWYIGTRVSEESTDCKCSVEELGSSQMLMLNYKTTRCW